MVQRKRTGCPKPSFLWCLCAVGPFSRKHRSSGFCQGRKGLLLDGEGKQEAALGPFALQLRYTSLCLLSVLHTLSRRCRPQVSTVTGASLSWHWRQDSLCREWALGLVARGAFLELVTGSVWAPR